MSFGYQVLGFGGSGTAASAGNDNGLFGYGYTGLSMTNIVSNVGVVGTDVTGVGTGRGVGAACEYGGDKAIFGYGNAFPGTTFVSMTNLVTNVGVVGTDVTGVGTARSALAACSYGGDKGIFGYGNRSPGARSMTNLVTNVGVVGTDVTGVGSVNDDRAACEYGVDTAIFGFGHNAPGGSPTYLSITNLVSNTGVCSTDVAGVGTVKKSLAACDYGGDKGIFGYGYSDAGGSPTWVSTSNLISNTGVCSTDVSGVGTARSEISATQYGGDKGIFGYGTKSPGVVTNITNLVSNVGVCSADVTGVGTARRGSMACSYN